MTDGLILALCAIATIVTLGLWQPSITLPEAVGNVGGISTAIIFTFLATWYTFRRWRDAAGERQQREVLEGRLAERALRLGRHPTWRFTSDGPEACTRNIEAATGAISSLGDVILKGPSGKDDKSAADIGLLLDYLTENLSHSIQQSRQPALHGNKSTRQNSASSSATVSFAPGDIAHRGFFLIQRSPITVYLGPSSLVSISSSNNHWATRFTRS